jgi:hypothetical protein
MHTIHGLRNFASPSQAIPTRSPGISQTRPPFIEHNFLAGRTFADLPDLNAQARAFCDTVNAAPKRHLHASPRELFAAERAHLRPLPLFVPEVYALHHRPRAAVLQAVTLAVHYGLFDLDRLECLTLRVRSRSQSPFSMWVISREQNWVNSGERRSRG